MKSFDAFTLIVLGILFAAAMSAIGAVLWINRPGKPDEHAIHRFIG